MTRSYARRYLVVAGCSAAVMAGFVTRLWAEKATNAVLGGTDRYLTFVSTDKPIYRPGEAVYLRGVILRADTHAPLDKAAQAQAMVEVRGPKGDVVAGGWVPSEDSVLGFRWDIPAGQAGGEYTAKINYPAQGFPPAERKFDIRVYRAPRLKSQIVFLRDGYGPGDDAGATLHVERAEGGLPDGAKVTVTARVDGEEVFRGPTQVDKQGNCTARFKLPSAITRGEGTVAFAIEDGGVVETATKTIPILLQTVDLQLYPEGGDLVAGLPTRVYLEAKTPALKPADIAGVVVDGDGQQAASFRTEHEGRGRFAFTPRKGGTYTLKITEPSGIKTTYPLPAVKDSGAVIGTMDDVTDKEGQVRLRVGSTTGGSLTVSLCKRENELASVKYDAKPSDIAEVTLTPPAGADGVLVATVRDGAGKPLAERLLYRRPAHAIRIDLSPERKSYIPGEKVKLSVRTSDDAGKPIGAVVGLAVTDDSVLEMIEKREQAPRLPAMVLLEQDVRELADAHVYLDPENPKAPVAVDLLLGTQGWRRFAFIGTEKFLSTYGDSARRVLALRMPSRTDMLMRGMGPMGGVEAFGRARGGNARAMPDERIELAEAAMPPPAAVADDAAKLGVDKDALGEREGALRDDRPVAAKVPAPVVAARPARLAKEEAELPAIELARKDQQPLADAMDKAVADEGRKQLLGNRQMAGGRAAAARHDFVPVRIYAHDLRPNRQPADRVDFAETLFWHAGIRTDDATGEASVSFALSDAVTAFRIFADGFSGSGALGQAASAVESVEPFYIEPKMPLEVTAGDVIRLPIGVVSGLSQDLSEVRITAVGAAGLKLLQPNAFALKARDRRRCMLDVEVGATSESSKFVVNAQAGPYSDKVTRELKIKPSGFPIELAHGGLIAPDSGVSKEIVIPGTLVAGSVTAKVAVYPTPLANMTEALERLIQEPNGCFEQTSSTCYPLIMAQQYFTSHTGVPPAVIQRSREMLDKGYARLASYECKQKGYEWFGADPGHEALTAYGIMEFNDMGQVREVDKTMVARTREWLLKRRDGKGGFQLDSKAIDSFGRAPVETTAAYITWALLETGEKDLQPELAALKAKIDSLQDTYVLALAANAFQLAGDADSAKRARQMLLRKQEQSGAVAGGVTSITCSGGEALQIETTALAVLAWLRDPACTEAVEKSIRFLSESCKAGRYGSTQSSILALRAIVNYDRSRARPKAAGSVRVLVDGKPVGDFAEFNPDTQGTILLPDIKASLTPGKHTVELKMNGGSEMPFSVAVNYNATKPASSDKCSVDLTVALAEAKVTEGAVTEANVVVSNRLKDGVPMAVAIVGLPGGLEPRHDQLKELVKAGTVAAYEVIGREVVLYWRELKPQQEIRFPISLVAAIPGTYTGPASRTYLYYTDEFKTWKDGLQVTISPRTTE